jgi:amidase
LNGYGFNPWDARRDPREQFFDGRPVLGTGGSSSGAGTNVSFWAANVGTETSGSILSPSNQNMLVGIKPTVGRVSRYGVIPITADQDTPGPMARTVTDAAIMLGVLEGAQPDPNDSATKKCPPPAGRDYTRFLNPAGLKGARIGIPRAVFYEQLNDAQKKSMEDAIAVLKAQGAIVVDSANIPSVREFNAFNICSGYDNAKGMDANCSVILKYGMKRDFNAWLKSLGDRAPVKTLTELREWNVAHQKAGAIKYGQANLDISDEMDVRGDREKYEADRRKDILLAGTNGIDAALKANRLDALFFPGVSSAGIAARPGYPSVTVPWALLSVSGTYPAGFTPRPAPFNVTFTASSCAEPKLIELAFAFEQATRKRTPPPLFP